MKLKYLGTAAAEGIPGIFCECETCKCARELGGRNIRTRSQALIDGQLLIDFPADTYMHMLQHAVALSKIKNCLITHAHSDHLYTGEITMRKEHYAHILDDKAPLVFYADAAGYNEIFDIILKNNIPKSDVQLKQVELYVPFTVDGYMVTALRAAHDPQASPVVYLIEKDGKMLFYAHDSSEYPVESILYLKALKKPLNLVSLDCTEACNHSDYMGHLDIGRCDRLRSKLIHERIADKNTVFVLNHFSHNGKNVLYNEFLKIAEKYKFLVSYDGMEIEV